MKFEYAESLDPFEKVIKKEIGEQLLEALIKMTNEYIFTRGQLNNDTEEELADVLCIKNARAAIAKAIGKEE